MLLSSAIVDFYLFYDEAVDMQSPFDKKSVYGLWYSGDR